MNGNVLICIDENIWSKKLVASGEFVFFKKSCTDEAIISAINLISNSVIFFTKNDKHFVSKLKADDLVVRVQGELSREDLDKYLCGAASIVRTHTSLQNKSVSLTKIEENGETTVRLVATSTGSRSENYKIDSSI
ncbi:hypothetical protein COY05_02830 [Candidatus Peregrinibacteria bacterium CG_4_10_14_0_2_um_filter_38_24]|nr:MAG: hypothetical protein COY05_02830 [Candidatus Peregrinibacteria bacterium CG_4_10_14_0_2_um_filter_38_24]